MSAKRVMMFWEIVVCAVMPAIPAFPPEAAAQERTQAEVARDLRSADTIRIRAALNEFARIPVAEQTPELRRALVEALERERANPMFGDMHMLVGMVEAALEIGRAGDPVAIPVLRSSPCPDGPYSKSWRLWAIPRSGPFSTRLPRLRAGHPWWGTR